jgi:hypothetical protein
MGLISNGSTIFDNGSMGSGFGGSLVFLSKQTASASANISFTSGIDSTYKEYLFTFKNIHPASDGTAFKFQANASGGSGYNETITSTFFSAYHNESGSDSTLSYFGSNDQAQGTSFQDIHAQNSADNDHGTCGTLHLYNPSSTTFVKHFIATLNGTSSGNYSRNDFSAGYFNTTNAIDEIQFKFESGNIDAGDICLYGIA